MNVEVTKTADVAQLTKEVFERLGIIQPNKQQVELVQALFDYLVADGGVQFNESLSSREKTCLYLLARGKNLDEVAISMKVKRTTVATFIKRIKHKLGCETLPQAVFEGMLVRNYIG